MVSHLDVPPVALAPGAPRKRGRPRQEQPSAAYRAKQAEIVDVAIEVFRERGFELGTLDDVAACLGAGRASLYHYVPSKAHLLYLIFDRAISTTLEIVGAKPAKLGGQEPTIPEDSTSGNLKDARESLERGMVEQALRRSGGKITSAAAELGISRPTLYELIEKLGLKRE